MNLQRLKASDLQSEVIPITLYSPIKRNREHRQLKSCMSPLRTIGSFDSGGVNENRTHDLLLARQMLSQLSYNPIYKHKMGLEPTMSLFVFTVLRLSRFFLFLSRTVYPNSSTYVSINLQLYGAIFGTSDEIRTHIYCVISTAPKPLGYTCMWRPRWDLNPRPPA